MPCWIAEETPPGSANGYRKASKHFTIGSWLENPRRRNTPERRRDPVPTGGEKSTPSARAIGRDARLRNELRGRDLQVQVKPANPIFEKHEATIHNPCG